MTLCQNTWPLRFANGIGRRRAGKRKVSGSGSTTASEALDSSTTSTDETEDDDDDDDQDSCTSSFGYFDSTESLNDMDENLELGELFLRHLVIVILVTLFRLT